MLQRYAICHCLSQRAARALLEGHIETFMFFGGVAQRNIYDNMRTIVNDGWGKHVGKEQKTLSSQSSLFIQIYLLQPWQRE